MASKPLMKMNARLSLLLAGLLLAALALTGPVPAAHAAGITVDSLTDDGTGCTLREAIQSANGDTAVGDCTAGSGADTITFSASGTITLGSTLPSITSNITIDGAGKITISGNNQYRLLSVANLGNLTVEGLTLSHGSAFNGGGIDNAGGGTVTVSNSTLSGNSATRGGGIHNARGGTVTVSNSTLSGNSGGGGGIYNDGGTVTVSNSTLSGNRAATNAGGGILDRYGTVTVSNSTLSANSAANSGGGIYTTGGTVTVSNSTLSGNSTGSFGGGIGNVFGTVRVRNSTIFGNSATSGSGGGIYENSGAVTLSNSIIANNSGGDCYFFISANRFNFDTDGTCGNATQTTAALLNLQPLADNGGPTETIALGAGSVAVDAGDNTTCTATDQRGVTRPQGAACDVGAFEMQSMLDGTPPVITPTVVGTLGENDWYTSDIEVSWSVVDTESDISSQSGCATVVIDADTARITFTCSATSAGGDSSESVTVKRDATPPSISGSFTPDPNVSGWNNTDVDVTFTCSDALSGIATCTPPQTLSSEGAGQNVNGQATDQAGNSNSTTVGPIKIDKTAPTVAASVSPDANANGWHNSQVTVSFSGTDGLSGIASCVPAVVLGSEGANQSAGGTCTDDAGNVSALATASGIDIDLTPPAVSVTGVGDGATYILGSVPTAGCQTTDALSGVATSATVAVSGGTDGVGDITATCAGAEDNAGNNQSGDVSVTYTVMTPAGATEMLQDKIEALVVAGVLKQGQAKGLLQPLNNAIRSLEKDSTADACNQLQDFIDEVNLKTPAPLDAATAGELIGDVEAIRTALGCG